MFGDEFWHPCGDVIWQNDDDDEDDDGEQETYHEEEEKTEEKDMPSRLEHVVLWQVASCATANNSLPSSYMDSDRLQTKVIAVHIMERILKFVQGNDKLREVQFKSRKGSAHVCTWFCRGNESVTALVWSGSLSAC